MRVLRFMAPLLVVIALAGCEEMVEDDTKPTAPKPKEPAALFRDADLERLAERWAIVPGDTPALPAESSRSRIGLASATEGFSGFPAYYTFSNAWEYGACVTFTVDIRFPDDPDYPDLPAKALVGTAHAIDCVGEAAPGNPVEGLFHAAHMCHGGYGCGGLVQDDGTTDWRCTYVYHFDFIFRAGTFTPELVPLFPDDYPPSAVRTTFREHPDGTLYEGTFSWFTHMPDHPEIPTNWVVASAYVQDDLPFYFLGFEDIDKSSERFHWSIDHSEGVAKLGENDWAAKEDYLDRCATIATEESPAATAPPRAGP